MKNNILKNILNKKGDENILQFLLKILSGSELNSLLLNVFQKKTGQLTPSELLKNYINNRFVSPLNLDPIAFREFELSLLKFIQKSEFEIFESSPLAPLGTSSVVAEVNQNNVLSATRGTEVVSDLTNVMALEIAKRKSVNRDFSRINLCGTHRHVRTQVFDFPGFMPHFKILGLVSSGRDSGNYRFEVESMTQHLKLFAALFEYVLNIKPNCLKVDFTIFTKSNSQYLTQLYERIVENLPITNHQLTEKTQSEFEYYKNIRFKLSLKIGKKWMEIGDGGFVNWTQQLLQNKKERLLISGIGIEFLYRILNQKI